MANVQLVDNLRRLRDEHNYTQLQLSKKLNISRQAYSNYETGKRIPDIETLLRLTDIYGISLEDLIARPFTRMSNTAVSREDRVPYTPGLVIKSGDRYTLRMKNFFCCDITAAPLLMTDGSPARCSTFRTNDRSTF